MPGRAAVTWVGGWFLETVSTVGGIFALLGRAGSAALWAGSPRRWRWTREQMVAIGVKSLGVTGAILFLVGMVIAFQTAYQMRSIGAEILIPGLLAVSIVRELGPMLTALVIAGRAGAAMTAELGSMKVTEQVEALETMSVDPVEHLVVPRLWASVVTVPLLTIFASAIGILGGFLVCYGKLGISPTAFTSQVFKTLVMGDIIAGLAKSFIFGMLICVVSCYQGLGVSGGASGVGRSTMRAVVVSFLLIILADFVFTVLFYLLP
jgi:phospholipid/cholesterol/gamma-HCH transport system permease protein